VSPIRLWLIAVPALVMVLAGVNLLATAGDSRDPNPDRAPGLADMFGDLTWLNWGTTVAFAAVAVATYILRRRAGRPPVT